MIRIKHKKLAVLGAALAVVAIAGAAFAYFTNNGTGAGTASVGTSSTIELSSPLVGDLYPDGPDVAVTVTIHNPGAGSQHVGTVSGVVNTNNNGTPAVPGDDCLGSWFQVDPVIYNATLTADDNAAGGTDEDTADTVVRMVDNGASQDACKLKTMSITWSSN